MILEIPHCRVLSAGQYNMSTVQMFLLRARFLLHAGFPW
jgi:hypothetical protein